VARTFNYKRPDLKGYQSEIIDRPERFTITEASTKSGKTVSHIVWLFEQALFGGAERLIEVDGKGQVAFNNNDQQGKEYWWVAPVYSQAEIAYKRLKLFIGDKSLYKENKSKLLITLFNGAEIHFKSAEKPDNLYGSNVYAVVFDEFTRAKKEAWTAIRSTLTTTKGKCKFIGNYKGAQNWGHKLGKKAETDPEYYYRKIDAYEAVRAGVIDLAEVEQAKKDLPDADFKALYLCQGSIDEFILFHQANIYDLFTNKYVEKTSDHKRYLCADLAYYGTDKFVIHVWEGNTLIKIFEFDKSGGKEIISHIERIAEEFGVSRSRIAYDATGAEWAEDWLSDCVQVDFRRSPIVDPDADQDIQDKIKKSYKNLKAQLYYHFAKMVKNGEVYIRDEEFKDEIIEELEFTRRKDSPDGKLLMEEKSKQKSLLGRSPDHADTLAIRNIFYLNPEAEEQDHEWFSLAV